MSADGSDQLSAEISAFARGKVPRELRLRHVRALAYELFAERGFTAASMEELAHRAGVSKPVIYDLVGSKEDLFATVTADVLGELAKAVYRAVDAEKTPDGQLRAGTKAFFNFVETHHAAWRSIMVPEAAPVSTVIAAARRSQDSLVGALLLRAMADSGASLDPVFVGAWARAINGMFEALATYWTEHPELDITMLAGLATSLIEPALLTFLNSLAAANRA